MKAVILAAGRGSRISAISGGLPKSLLPLGDTTLLGHSLRLMARSGISEAVVVTGYERRAVAEHARRNWPGTLRVVYNPHFASTNVLYSLWLALPCIGREDFLFLHGDTVFSAEVLTRTLRENPGAEMLLPVDRHPCGDEEMKVRIADGNVRLITKLMPPEEADGEFLGLARVSGSLTEKIREKAENIFEEGDFTAFFELALQRLIDEDSLRVPVCDVTGLAWREVDFPEDYAAARALFPAG